MDYKYRNLLLQNRMFIVKVTIVTLIVFVLAISKIAYAQIDDNKIDIFLDRMEKTNKRINTISADYIQTIFFESTKEEKKNYGKLFFKKNCGIYINQKTPHEQQVYFDGKNMTIYTPKNRQAIIDNRNSAIYGNFTYSSLLSLIDICGDLKRMKKINMINLVDENEKYVLIKINVLSKKSHGMKVYISKLNMYPEKVIMESNGVVVEIVFNNYIVNPILNKNMFKFNMSNDIGMIKLN